MATPPQTKKLENRSPPSTPRQQNKYKTEMCNKLPGCPYGKLCRFAHTEAELRRVKRSSRYKTERCKNYDETGACPYGLRCVFIHADDNTVARRWKTPVIPLGKPSNHEALYVWSSWAGKCKASPAPLKESRLANVWTKESDDVN